MSRHLTIAAAVALVAGSALADPPRNPHAQRVVFRVPVSLTDIDTLTYDRYQVYCDILSGTNILATAGPEFPLNGPVSERKDVSVEIKDAKANLVQAYQCGLRLCRRGSTAGCFEAPAAYKTTPDKSKVRARLTPQIRASDKAPPPGKKQ